MTVEPTAADIANRQFWVSMAWFVSLLLIYSFAFWRWLSGQFTLGDKERMAAIKALEADITQKRQFMLRHMREDRKANEEHNKQMAREVAEQRERSLRIEHKIDIIVIGLSNAGITGMVDKK